MTPHQTTPAATDDIDRLLSGFFQGQMPRTWPSAPAFDAEPSSLAASRNVHASGSRSRWVLAASVALLVGTCWYAAQGTTPTPTASKETISNRAKAMDTNILDEMRKHRTVGEADGVTP